MHPVAVVSRCRAVGTRANEWVRELRPPSDAQHSGVLGGVGRGHVDPETVGGTVEQDGVTDRLGGRRQDKKLRVGRKPAEAPNVARFDPPGDGKALRQPEPARQLGDAPGAREFEQGERVAVALDDDPLADGGIQRTVQVLEQQRERIAVAQPSDGELGEPGQDLVADPSPGRAHDRHAFGEEPAGHERQDLHRDLIEPLRVVDDADQRLLLCDVGEQRQRRQPDQEPVWGRAVAQPEDRRQRGALGRRQPLEAIEHGRTELMQPVVGQLHLRLDAHRPGEAGPVRVVGDVFQQRALADAGFAAQHHDSAATGDRIRHEPVEDLAFGVSPEESHRPLPPTAPEPGKATSPPVECSGRTPD